MNMNNRKLSVGVLVLSLLCMGVSAPSQVDAAKTKTQRIKLSQTKLTMTVGKTKTLKVKGTPAKLAKKVKWKSSKTKVVKVSSKGKLTAKKAGTAKITVTSKTNKKIKAVCKVTVKAKKTSTAPTSGSAISYPTWGLADAPYGTSTNGAIQFESHYYSHASYQSACFTSFQSFQDFFTQQVKQPYFWTAEYNGEYKMASEMIKKYDANFFQNKVLFYTEKNSYAGSYKLDRVELVSNMAGARDCRIVFKYVPESPGTFSIGGYISGGIFVELNRDELKQVSQIYVCTEK